MEPNPNGQNTFSLDATSGYVTTPDGNSVYMWSYTATGRSFQLPGPTLCVTSGTTVTVTLRNSLPEATSITLPGQDDVSVGGQPVAPEFDGTGVLTSLTNSAAATSGTVTYSFKAGSPGTYLYSSGTDVTKQREMGLYGALVVRPAGHPDWANDDSTTVFDPTTEYVYVLSQIDPDFHSAVEKNRAYNANTSTARYFFINGRSMPDTLAPNNASWMPTQPYGALVHIQANAPRSALIRYVNAGPTDYAFHPHGSGQRLITRDGSDGRRDRWRREHHEVPPRRRPRSERRHARPAGSMEYASPATRFPTTSSCRSCRTRSSAPVRRPGSARTRTSALPG